MGKGVGDLGGSYVPGILNSVLEEHKLKVL